MDLVLGLDAGTTGVRAVAFDPGVNPVQTAYRALTQHYPSPGEVEHDPGEILSRVREVLAEVARWARERGDTVVALGLTNQRETTIAFDRATGDFSHRAIVWQDRRTVDQCARLEREGHRDLVRRVSGLVLDPYFSGTKMRWLVDHGALATARQPSLSTIDAWLVWHLTGGVRHGAFVTEPSNASRTMLMDLASRQWSAPLCDLLGVDPAMLPELRCSAGHFGDVDGSVVPELAGVPITGVLGDQQAALFGQACFDVGMVKATYGTGAFVLAHAGDAPPAPVEGLIGTVAWDLGAHGPLAYALEGSAFVAGAAVQWLRDELGLIEHAHDLEPLARTVADAGGVVFVLAFTGLGSPFWRPEARGSISGLARGTTRGHLARAILDAQAYQVRAMTDAFVDAGVELRELRADGGAAAMDLLMDLQASCSRVTVRRSATLEATARGAATLAGLVAGQWESLEVLAGTWRCERESQPGDPTRVDADYAAWRRTVERTSSP